MPVDSRYIVGSRTAVSRNTALVAGRAVEAAALGSAMVPATGELIEPLLSNVDRLTDPVSRLLRARFTSILSSPVNPSLFGATPKSSTWLGVASPLSTKAGIFD